MGATGATHDWRKIPKGVWALGFVSLLMDVSSEMIHALLPVYLVTFMGTTALVVGVIEGVAEATASIVKVFSGSLSDWTGRRKWLAATGYGLAAITKPVFALATTVNWLIAARFIDRIGKGIRGAPRDALVADLSPAEIRGASFGLRQSLDTVGAFLGPLLAIGLMFLSENNFNLAFWIAVVPAFLSFGLIVLAVKEPPRISKAVPIVSPVRFVDLPRLDNSYWAVLGIGVVFTFARFSEAFLILKAQSLGLSVMMVPIVLVIMNIAYALSAYPVGLLSDRMDRKRLLPVGLGILIAADLILANATSVLSLFAGVFLWGMHMGFTQGVFAALVADTAPPEKRGTAFGIYNLATGVALLVASVLAGSLWDTAGHSMTFYTGAVFAALALGGLFLYRVIDRRGHSARHSVGLTRRPMRKDNNTDNDERHES